MLIINGILFTSIDHVKTWSVNAFTQFEFYFDKSHDMALALIIPDFVT